MNPAIPNQAVSASAGAGKTYQLTNRFIRLLHHFEEPERIAALTFTRAAAGEFFIRIVDKLAAGASGPEAARKLSAETGIEADAARYRALLRLLLERMHRLNLQTLDSFFHRIASAFALELGLAGDLRLLDERAAPRARRAVRDRMIHRERQLSGAMEKLWQAFNQATYGRDERSIERILAGFIDSLHQLYLEAPDAERWGEPAAIWGGACPWNASDIDVEAEARTLLAHLPEDLGRSQRKALEKLAAEATHHPAEQRAPSTLLRRVLEAYGELRQGSVALTAGGGKKKDFTLSGPAAEALEKLARSVVWFELERALQTTRGAFRVLTAFDALYDRLVRRSGRLAFGDILHLLSTSEQVSPLRSGDPDTRLLLDYRLDARFDHWLLDEFQDTSRLQWSVIENLIDEVLQDSSGQRTVFYVGDTKQCLYLWRNSDDRLFHEIAERYAGNLERRPLYHSWRSAPAVLDAVNAVFDDEAVLTGQFGPQVAARWKRAWNVHEPSPGTAAMQGHFCWLRAGADGEEDSEAELVLRLLEDLRPLERGIRVGILARTNDKVRATADFIRSRGGPPVHTGSAVEPAIDNAAGSALLSLLKLASHPGDRFARRHLEMTGLCAQAGEPPVVAARLRNRIAENGPMAGVEWAARLITQGLEADDAYHRSRLTLLVDAARAFEEEDDERSLDELHAYLETFTSSEVRSGEAVVIETIHKAKGLEYDCVLLLESGTRTALRMDGGIRALRREGSVDWILKPFGKDFMEADPELARFRKDTEDEGGFAALCTLYVAMTRARQALYMISPEGRADRGSVVRFLREVLGREEMETGDRELFGPGSYPVIWETGSPDWSVDLEEEVERSEAVAEPGAKPRAGGTGAPRLKLLRPSAADASLRSGDRFFLTGPRATAFGSAVHKAFESVDWLSPGETAHLPDGTPDAVRETVDACLAVPEIRKRFVPPEGDCLLWREKAFARADGEHLVSGTFDRVILQCAADGRYRSAEIIDFKTDRIHEDHPLEQASEHHRPQLEAYRSALAALTGLPESAIRLTLIFTGGPAVVSLG